MPGDESEVKDDGGRKVCWRAGVPFSFSKTISTGHVHLWRRFCWYFYFGRLVFGAGLNFAYSLGVRI